MFSKFRQPNDLLAVFMLETLKFSKTLKSSRDDFNVLENFNVSSIKTANKSLGCRNLENIWIMHKTPILSLWICG